MFTLRRFNIAFAMLFGSASLYYIMPQTMPWNTQDLIVDEIRRRVTLELRDSVAVVREKIDDNMELVGEVMISEAERMNEMRESIMDSVTNVAEMHMEHEENH